MDNNNKGNGLIWIVVLVVVVILGLVGLYLYQNKQATTVPAAYQQAQTEDNLQTEIDSVDVNGTNTEFDALDKDLQSL